MNYGDIVTIMGIAFIALAVIAFIAGNIVISVKKRGIKKELTDYYGF